MGLESELHAKIESLSDTWITFMQELVRIPSCSGNEHEAQAFDSQTMKDLGMFHKHVYYRDHEKKYVERNYDDRPNVVGLIPGKSERNFVLNAHIDTVMVEDESSWIFPPFAAEIHDGRLYGRGALDDKAGVAMMLMIAQSFLETDFNLPFNIYFESVIEDEDTGNGTKACTEAGIYADAAIVIDGTWPFRIIDAHLGQLWIDFDIRGVPVASCSHKRGKNPIDIALRLLQELNNFIDVENNKCHAWHNIDDPYFVTPGVIQSGIHPGAVPEKCNLICQLGFPPPETMDSICSKIDGLLSTRLKEDREFITYHIRLLGTNSFENRNNRLVQLLSSTIKRLRAGEMEPINVAVTGHCDLRNLRTKTGQPSEACLYGPGGGGSPHAKDEFYIVEHFVPVAQNIMSTMLAWYT